MATQGSQTGNLCQQLVDGLATDTVLTRCQSPPRMNRIRELRQARNLSQEKLGERVGTDKTQISKLEKGGRRLTDDWIRRLASALRVTPAELLEGNRSIDSETSGVETRHAGVDTHGLVIVRELDIRARAGTGGGLIDVENTDEDAATVAEYGFPGSGFRELYGAQPDRVRIIEVVGDSMEPTLFPGQKVMVDTEDRAPTPPGIFIVYDGFGLVLKRVQYVAHSDPPQVRISSDNKEYEPYTRSLDEAHIQGRVIGGWRRM